LTEIWTLGVEELVIAIEAGELGPVEVVEAFATRADEVDAVLNCFITLDGDASGRAAARERAAERGPLHGVPYAYKDVFAYRGVTPTVGTRGVTLDLRARSAAVLDRLDGAGAIALGSLNLDPLAYAATGANPDFGDVCNPWDPSRIAGGSSGGAAAAVAAGAVPFAIGTDAGGSIRIPAALCGITGLKPTLGRIPKIGAAPLSYSQDTVGILARSARDVALVLEHVAGHDPKDPASIAAPIPAFAELEGSCEGTRIGFDRDGFAGRTTPEIAAAAESALVVFEALGADPVEVDLSLLEDLDTAATVLTWAEVSAIHERTFRADPTRYSPAIRARLELALGAQGADHVNAMRLQGRALAHLLTGPLAAADVLLVPTIADAAVTIGSLQRDAVDVSIGHLRLNRPFNFTGVPALAVPVGFSAGGLPLGVQLVTRPWAERTLLGCAAAYQAETDWHRRLPPLPGTVHGETAGPGSSTRIGPLV
jgi:aspartyl-tRNA(Asn)/glutamyl-tRNA(Gln) amidotransferase subunit A